MGLLRFWPVTNAPKIVLFLNELEHVSSVLGLICTLHGDREGGIALSIYIYLSITQKSVATGCRDCSQFKYA